jgi:hypothetical protein
METPIKTIPRPIRAAAICCTTFAPAIISLAVVWLLTGCTTYGYKTPLGETTYAPVDYHKVKLLFGAPDQKYEVIGVVSVQGGTWASEGDMYQKLIKSAAQLGADAVIVTGEGSQKAIIPGVSSTVGTSNTSGNATATDYGNTVDVYGNASTTATATTYASPTYIADMPTNKGLAIKFSN